MTYHPRSSACSPAPVHAGDLRDLPPALVVTAEHDPLCAEGERYASRAAVAEAAEFLRGTWEPNAR